MNIGVKQKFAKVATSQTDPKEVTQMVTDRKKNSAKAPVKQGPEDTASEPNKINASTPYDFSGKNLTPYGGLLPVITMLEKLGFQSLVEWNRRQNGYGCRSCNRIRHSGPPLSTGA